MGLPLSSGIDSGAIACILKKLGVEFTAFTVGYEGRPRTDEREKAIELAKYLDVPIVEVEIKESDLVKNFPSLIKALEVPISDLTNYAYYVLFKTMKEHGITLCVSGQGSDELFFGYNWTNDTVFINDTLRKMRAHGKKSPSLLSMLYLFRASAFNDYTFKDWRYYLWPLRRQFRFAVDSWKIIKQAEADNIDMFFYERSPGFVNTHKLLRELYTEDFKSKLDDNDLNIVSHLNKNVSSDVFLTAALFHSYMLENGLTQGNNIARNTGGVMSACPFIDMDLVNTVIGLRKNYHDWKLGYKAWLRKAMRGIVPDAVLGRRKQGFNPPWGRWVVSLLKEYGHNLRGGFLSEQNIFTDEALDTLSHGPEARKDLPYYKALLLELWGRYMQESGHMK